MAFLSQLRTQILSWWEDTPLPGDLSSTPIFQEWHEFDAPNNKWDAVDPTSSTGPPRASSTEPLVLVTWNVDYKSPLPEARISAILSRILTLSPAVDIIFLQEVSRAALLFLLGDARIQQHWISSDADATNLGGQSFTTVTLLSRERFGRPGDMPGRATPGRVWRVKYPTRFGRDALCCDVFVPSPGLPNTGPARIRLVNVHLDSLAIQPSRRPQQISIVSSLLRSAGRGLVAADFNPVLPQDETLVQENRLVDAWPELHPGELGFTWGIDGKKPFPPNRMDRVATLGLKVDSMEILHPGSVEETRGPGGTLGPGETRGSKQDGSADQPVPWSDHSGLTCSFRLVGA